MADPGVLFGGWLAKPRRVCYDAHGNLSNALDRVGTARQVRRDGKLSGDEGAARPAVLLPLPLPPGETPAVATVTKGVLKLHTKWTARRLAADAMFAAMVTVLGLVSISTGNLKITV